MSSLRSSILILIDAFSHPDCRATGASGDSNIHGQNTTVKRWENPSLQPFPEDRALRRIAPFGQQDTDFKLEEADGRNEQVGCVESLGPFGDIRVGFAEPDFSKFGNHVRIEKKH
jgi:hypothetical protein